MDDKFRDLHEILGFLNPFRTYEWGCSLKAGLNEVGALSWWENSDKRRHRSQTIVYINTGTTHTFAEAEEKDSPPQQEREREKKRAARSPEFVTFFTLFYTFGQSEHVYCKKYFPSAAHGHLFHRLSPSILISFFSPLHIVLFPCLAPTFYNGFNDTFTSQITTCRDCQTLA